MTALIRETYAQCTQESAGAGDFSDTGWIDQDGTEIEPEEDETIVDAVVSYLRDHYACEASSSHFHPGVWYSTGFYYICLRTGTEEERSFHVVGLAERDAREVFVRMVGDR